MISVLQMVDSLALGGAETVALSLANELSLRGVRSALCATRRSGPLEERLRAGVPCLNLRRCARLDLRALWQNLAFIREHQIQIIHAHSTSLFWACLLRAARPSLRVVWHDHFGRCDLEERPAWLYRLAVSRTAAIVAVNESLANWTRSRLKVGGREVLVIPNFVSSSSIDLLQPLPGRAGFRIVCVANLRPQKDHLTLISAFRQVVQRFPDACLLLVGSEADTTCVARVRAAVVEQRLERSVSFLGSRSDVPAILRGCDLGVLSSRSEGLPLALLEYGVAELPVVATAVGDVPRVLDGGRVGKLVAPANPDVLAQGMIEMFEKPAERNQLGGMFRDHVQKQFGVEAVLQQWLGLYRRILQGAG